MKLCEQCGVAPPAFPGRASWAGSRYCGDCLNEKANLILNVFEVIRYYGADVEET